MELLMVLIVGGLAGWLASIIVNRNEQMGIFWNIIAGILGAALANWVIAPWVGVRAELGTFNLSSFLMAVLGASLLLVIYNLITRKRVR